ncbi:MAG: hypothetical protein KA795_12080 [Burkholderiaceae bacterium]|nr:hypothetical protein [Burkholderiaceae bacterium]
MSLDAPRMPPRFVPTLTEVVADVPRMPPADAAPAPIPAALPAPASVLPAIDHEELARSVLERVTQTLEPLLADAVAAVARQHSLAMTQHLAETVEDVVSGLVADAVRAELAARREA